MTKLRQARVEQAEGQTVWAKADKPLEKRVAATFLFGLKKTLVEKWGYSKTIVWVDEEKLTLKVGGELVVTAQVVQEAAGSEGTGVKRLDCMWHKTTVGDWNTWEWAQKSEDLKELQEKAAETLKRSSSNKGKGKNKGN